MSTGFESMAAQADGLARQAQGLRAAVDSGRLVMEPDAADRLAKLYEDKADDINYELVDTDRLIANGAWGDCFIGRALEQKFSDKVNDPELGVVAILRRMEQILRGIAQAYRDSAKDYQNTEDDNVRNLRQDI